MPLAQSLSFGGTTTISIYSEQALYPGSIAGQRATMLRALGPRHAHRLAAHAYSTQTVEQQRVALVQGASRGLGLEFVRQLLQRPGQTVIAACRRPAEATQLQQLQQQSPNLHLVQLDCTDEGSIEVGAGFCVWQLAVAGDVRDGMGPRPSSACFLSDSRSACAAEQNSDMLSWTHMDTWAHAVVVYQNLVGQKREALFCSNLPYSSRLMPAVADWTCRGPPHMWLASCLAWTCSSTQLGCFTSLGS